jgi:hypothetical protein
MEIREKSVGLLFVGIGVEKKREEMNIYLCLN